MSGVVRSQAPLRSAKSEDTSKLICKVHAGRRHAESHPAVSPAQCSLRSRNPLTSCWREAHALLAFRVGSDFPVHVPPEATGVGGEQVTFAEHQSACFSFSRRDQVLFWGSQKLENCNVQVQAEAASADPAPRPRQGLWASEDRGGRAAAPLPRLPQVPGGLAATSPGAFPVAVQEHPTCTLQSSPQQDVAISVPSVSSNGPAPVL